jgi:eukaryotic-like serine/threonine-protein kinase
MPIRSPHRLPLGESLAMSTPHADRNLLFGILAVQMDFVSRDALIAAMNAWVLDKAKPLGHILVEQGALDADNRAWLEAGVERHLAAHGHDPQQSLAAVHTPSSIRQVLWQVADDDVQTSLAAIAADPYVREVATVPESPAARYRILRPHAQGGLGEVWVANDEELHREVALKEIKARYADDEHSRGRFLLEAEVTGRLEHPGIVPVYGLGTYADGRPFYAMRFIRGANLKEAIDRFYGGAGKPFEGERGVAFRQLLRRFLDVCNAVAYAHSRGVLHRDLKPGNIMLGKFGETLVVDWGLAKVVGRDSVECFDPDEATLRPSSGSGIEPTQVGSAIGTPAFMSPEQAAGRLDQLGPASDVYSLGATLYAVLTGRPPLDGSDKAEVLRAVQAGDIPRPSHVRPDVPRPLEAVCLKAMALRPAERYPLALSLAAEVERWLADEPVQAYPEPLVKRVRRWLRRHQAVAVGSSVLVLTTTVSLAVGLVLVNDEKGKTALALEQSQQAEESAREQRQVALQTVRRVVVDIHERLKDKPAQQELRKALLRQALDGLKEVARRTDTAKAIDHEQVRAHLELGDIFLEIEQGGTVEAKTQYERAHEIAKKLAEVNPTNAQAQQGLSLSYEKLGDVQLQLGDSQAALAAYQDSLKIRQRLAQAEPTNAEAQRDLSVSYDRLGNVQLQLGHGSAALAAYLDSLKIRQRLAQADPTNAQAQRYLSISYDRLGNVHLQLGDSHAALAAYRDSLKIRQRLAQAEPTSAEGQRDLSVSYSKVGDVQLRLGDSQAALAAYQDDLKISQRLAQADPTNAQAQRDLSVFYSKVGDMQLRLGDSQAALAAYLDSLKIRQRLAQADPTSAETQRDLLAIFIKLGNFDREHFQFASAVAWYDKALQVAKTFAKPDFFRQEMQNLEQGVHFCRAAEKAVADPASTLAQPAVDRPAILSAAMTALVKQKQSEKAVTAADLLAKETQDADAAYKAACSYALCVALTEKDNVKDHYAAHAVELLRLAVERGFKDTEHMKKDSELDALRQRDDFQKLLHELEGKSK